jgi:hypothetical protein
MGLELKELDIYEIVEESSSNKSGKKPFRILFVPIQICSLLGSNRPLSAMTRPMFLIPSRMTSSCRSKSKN